MALKVCFNCLGFLAFKACSQTCPLWPSQRQEALTGQWPKRLLGGDLAPARARPDVPGTKGQRRSGQRRRVEQAPGRGQGPVVTTCASATGLQAPRRCGARSGCTVKDLLPCSLQSLSMVLFPGVGKGRGPPFQHHGELPGPGSSGFCNNHDDNHPFQASLGLSPNAAECGSHSPVTAHVIAPCLRKALRTMA